VIPGLVERTVRGFDGTPIAYQVRGDGPAVVLANGLGGNAAAWRFLFERLGEARKVLSWDYRGLFHSGAPSGWGTLGPAEQARDLLAILEAEAVDRFAILGWSMGVQVQLEVYRAVPERVAAMVMINGVAGRPFDTALGWRFSRYVAPLLVAQVRRRARLMSWLTRVLVRWSGLLPAMRRIGLVGTTIDAAIFVDVARNFVTVDYDLYGATMEALAAHDAWDVLPAVRVPVAIVTGDRDLLTPVGTARRMAATIPGARLRVIRGGTHYTPVEFPRDVGDEVEAVLRQVGM
jgi:pimeloyl-ACP methyl ester carboxylesterase